MKLIVHIESEDAAITEAGVSELKRILNDFTNRLYFVPEDEDDHYEIALRDINGNKVGYAIISNL